MPIIEYPDGSIEDLGDAPGPDLKERARQKYLDLMKADFAKPVPMSFGQVVKTIRQTNEPILTPRRAVESAGAVVGALPGMASVNPPAAIQGAVAGAGMANLAYDMLTDKGDWRRNLVSGLGGAAVSMLPMTRALSFGKQIVATGLGTGVAAKVYDLAANRPSSVAETTTDVLTGMVGREVGEVSNRAAARRAGRQESRGLRSRTEQAQLEQFSQQEDIPLSAADKTGSVAAARLEQYPARQMIGARRPFAFRVKQVEAAEASFQRTLDRLDANVADVDPTSVGMSFRRAVPELAKHFRHAASQAYEAESALLGKDSKVSPDTFVSEAQKIMQEEGRSPFSAPGEVSRVASKHAETAPSLSNQLAGGAPLAFDALGNPVTMGDIAKGTRPLDWVQARHYLAQLGQRAFKSDKPVGTVSDRLRIRLWSALKKDMNATLAKNPDAEEFSKWVDTGYGAMKQTLNDRLKPLLDRPDAERVFGAAFQPGALERTQQLREFLPRDVFEKGAAGWLKQQFDDSLVEVGAGQRRLSVAKLSRRLEPYLRSGQVDEMFDGQTAQWLRDYRTFIPALATAEKIAVNPSGTGQAIISDFQAREVARNVLRMAGAPLAGMGGGAAVGNEVAGPMGAMAGGAAGLASATVLPAAVGRFAYSEPGINMLTRAVRGADPQTMQRELFRQYLSQSAARGATQ